MFPDNPNKMLITGGISSYCVWIVTFDPAINRIDIRKAASNMIIPRHSHRLVALDGYFYALGGITQKEELRDCERILIKEVETGQWTNIAPMKIAK